MTSTLITDEKRLVGAKYTRSDYAIPVYDDGFGKLFISRNSIGINGIVRARNESDAYEICEDEFFPEADETVEQLQKEYGFRRDHKKIVRDSNGERFAQDSDYVNGKLAVEFVLWETIETPEPDSWPENELFCEAYGFRPSGPNVHDKLGHGIYQKDLNGDYLDVLTPELAEEIGITILVAEWEEK